MSKDKDKKSKKSSSKVSIEGVKVHLPSILPEEITIQQRLGEGAYGEVYKGICRQAIVAVKYIKEEKYDPDALIAELTIMFQATSANIVKVQGVLVDEKNRPIGIVTEFLEGGDLENLLHPESGTSKGIPIDTKIGYAIDIALGMSWLTGKDVKIIHRDLKPANIMLDRTQTTCKICDFGLAVTNERKAKGKEGHTGDIKSTRGSPLWMAPERVVIKVQADEELKEELSDVVSNYLKSVKFDQKNANSTEKSDVYSFGIMLWEIITEEWPFVAELTTESFDELFTLILTGKRPSLKDIEAPLALILQKCWQPDPSSRPTFDSCITMLRSARVDITLPPALDSNAATFWKSSLGITETYYTIGNFVESLSHQGLLRPIKKGEQPLKQDQVAKCVALLFGKPTDDAKAEKISLSDFAKLLKWFGPLSSGEFRCIHHMVEILKHAWFFGPIERKQSEHYVDGTGVFVVRLNTGGTTAIEPNPFIISTEILNDQKKIVPFHIRVVSPGRQHYGKWFCSGPAPENKKFSAESIPNLISELISAGVLTTPVPKSPFHEIFNGPANEDFMYTQAEVVGTF